MKPPGETPTLRSFCMETSDQREFARRLDQYLTK